MLVQQSLEELGTPLAEVTFCVIDLETTGASPADCRITEIGAVKVRRGESAGTFQTLVNPFSPIPAFIRMLTGISEEMVAEAPPISDVLPFLLEFIKDSVLVAHNARFDIAFLDAALIEHDYEPLPNKIVDTALLARKVLAGDVPNHRLETLARHLRCPHTPNHRAFTDVLATVDVLHHLIERVAGFGVTTLEDLMAVSRAKLDGTFSKIKLAEGLPAKPGVYRFLGDGDRVLYVGKATNLRSRVRAYFYGDRRRGIADLLKQTQRIVHETHPTMLEAEITEAREIAASKPPFNRAGKREARWYLKAVVRGKRARLAPARAPRDDGAVYLGPFPSIRSVRSLIDALRDALAIHRCSDPAKCTGCAFAQIGRCSGLDEGLHRSELRKAVAALISDPGPVLDALALRMNRLAEQERFEEAAEARDRAALLERTLFRNARAEALVRAGEVTLRIGERTVEVCGGILSGDRGQTGPRDYLPAEVFREATLIASFIERNAPACEVLSVSGTWSLPSGRGPSARFEIRKAG